VLVACGALGVACSPGPAFTDSGVDSGQDVKTDSPITPPDSGKDGAGDGGGPGPCTTTALTGDCDIVKQDCPSGKECVVAQTSDGGVTSTCQNNGNGTIPEGYACTPSGSNPCVSGLECIQNRCAKHCCLNDDSYCGTSHPEGFAGHCDLNVVDNNNNPMYATCTYSSVCQPFDIQKCGTDQTCLIKDNSGTAACVAIFGVDGGLAEKASCTAANACGDGMYCLSKADGGSACTWVCYSGGGPYDAGISSLPAGQGGCNNPETCHPVNWGGALPTWLGVCQ